VSASLSGFEVTRRATPARNSTRWLNPALAIALLAFLALVPIPLGANRPVFWSLSALIVGAIGAVYAALMLWRNAPFRFPLASFPVLAALWLAFCLLAALHFLLPVQTTFTAGNGVEIVSPTLSLAPGASLHSLVQFAGYGLFFFLMLQAVSNRRRAVGVARALFWIIVAHAIYGLVALTQLGDPLLFFDKWAYLGSATGTFVNRNSYATFLAFGLVLGTALALRAALVERGAAHARSEALLSLLGLAFVLAALLASQSRMGLAAGLAGSLLVLAGAIARQRAGRRVTAVLLAIVVMGLLALLATVFGAPTLERLGSAERDFDVRLDLYRQVIGMILERPVLGYGGGSFEIAFPLFHALPVSPDLLWLRAHSTYLALWSDFGLVLGSIPLVVMLGIALRCLQMTLVRTKDWALPLAALGVMLTAGIHSLVDFSLEIQANAYVFAAILALGFAASNDFSRRGRAA